MLAMEVILAFISIKNCNSFIPNSGTFKEVLPKSSAKKKKILNLMLECQKPNLNSDF